MARVARRQKREAVVVKDVFFCPLVSATMGLFQNTRNFSSVREIKAGIYRNLINVLRTAPFKAVNFYAYDTYRKQLLRLSGNEETTNSERFIAGAAAGITATVLCLPLDIKLKFEYHRPMKAIALDPDYARKSSRRFVTGGLAGHLYLNTKKWLGYKDQVLHSERPRGSPHPEILLPHLVWQDDALLVIGWGTYVKIASIRSNLNKGANGTYKHVSMSNMNQVNIVASFQTSCYISGIAPFGDSLVVLAYILGEDDGEKEFSCTIPSRQCIICSVPASLPIYLYGVTPFLTEATAMVTVVENNPKYWEVMSSTLAVGWLDIVGLESMYSLAQKSIQLKPMASAHKLIGLIIKILGENTEVVLAECLKGFGPW
ncbi:C-terminal isoform 1 [Hibiscus syriacus]|uniref:C-terminal isoform 1 n=1 Tax=Hibiscus syriacus TaxID=106335 RepID=A0A6A2YAC2_HIBSY|nr:C-terminal isoform 1 [Hibiscus syriacus]